MSCSSFIVLPVFFHETAAVSAGLLSAQNGGQRQEKTFAAAWQTVFPDFAGFSAGTGKGLALSGDVPFT